MAVQRLHVLTACVRNQHLSDALRYVRTAGCTYASSKQNLKDAQLERQRNRAAEGAEVGWMWLEGIAPPHKIFGLKVPYFHGIWSEIAKFTCAMSYLSITAAAETMLCLVSAPGVKPPAAESFLAFAWPEQWLRNYAGNHIITR